MSLINNFDIEKGGFQILINEKEKKDKKRLINVLERLKGELEDNDMETINEVYSYISDDANEFNKEKRQNINKCCKCLIESILPLFTIFYLFGIYIIISIKDLLFNLLISSIECRFDIYCDKEKFKKQSNFFDYFLAEQNKISINLNLVMFWSFIGIKFLYSLGFTITNIIFMILNIIILSIIYIFDFQAFEDNYSIMKILLLACLCFFTCITLGGSSLISQQFLINLYAIFYSDTDENEIEDNNDEVNDLIIYEENKENLNEIINEVDNKVIENKENIKLRKRNRITNNEGLKAINAFPIVCYTTVLGYFQKLNFCYGFLNLENENSNHTEKNETNTNIYLNQTNLTYFLQDNFTNENKFYRYTERTMFLIICTVYIICCISSIIFYRIFACKTLVKKTINKSNKENNSKCCVFKYFFEIFNCIYILKGLLLKVKTKKEIVNYVGKPLKITVIIAIVNVVVANITKMIMIRILNSFAIVMRKKAALIGLITFCQMIFKKNCFH